MMVADTEGYIKKALPPKARITTRPRYIGGKITVGTVTGELIEINPRFIR